MHLVAQPYKCLKCGHEFSFSPHEQHPAPTNSEQDPVCPVCWDTFLKTVGIGYCTVAWTKAGSSYERKVKEQQNDS
jgi:DNA-directed RNA polymerase subunit RPC12/RpoP